MFGLAEQPPNQTRLGSFPRPMKSALGRKGGREPPLPFTVTLDPGLVCNRHRSRSSTAYPSRGSNGQRATGNGQRASGNGQRSRSRLSSLGALTCMIVLSLLHNATLCWRNRLYCAPSTIDDFNQTLLALPCSS